MWQEIFEERQRQEDMMTFRHPWIPLCYNYLIAGLVILLFISFGIWGANIHADRRAATLAAEEESQQQAELQALADKKAKEEEEQRKKEQEQIDADIDALARMFYGIKLHIEKYRYSETDLETYARCPFNRYDYGHGLTALSVIISKPEQFTGYHDNNPLLLEYKTLAEKFYNEWKAEKYRPCSAEYRFAELTENGIFLTTEANADGYARRWHA